MVRGVRVDVLIMFPLTSILSHQGRGGIFYIIPISNFQNNKHPI
jgi:hypothetical protein